MIFPKIMTFMLFTHVMQLDVQHIKIKEISQKIKDIAHFHEDPKVAIEEIQKLSIDLINEIEKIEEVSKD